MELKTFQLAISILLEFHSIEIIINHCKSNGQVKLTNTIHIKNCCAECVKKLINQGFSLTMHDGLLIVDKL